MSKIKGELECIPSTEEKYLSFSKKMKIKTKNSETSEEKVNYYEI